MSKRFITARRIVQNNKKFALIAGTCISKIPFLKRTVWLLLSVILKVSSGCRAASMKKGTSLEARYNFLRDDTKCPLMTILVPVYNTDAEVLVQCLDSVLAQQYEKWELCVVDDASIFPHIRSILTDYARKDNRIKILFSPKNRGISDSINAAGDMATGAFLGVLDHDDELEPTTLLEYVAAINENPDADCIYCDEDKINELGIYCEPWFKSDWNPDLSLSFNYVMHFAVYRRSLFMKMGGVRRKYEGSQDYDLLLRASEHTDKIYHIPKILYHWRKGPGSIASGPSAKPDVFITGLAALNDALARRGIDGRAEDAPNAWKGVYRVKRTIARMPIASIIILCRGNKVGLSRLLNSIHLNIPASHIEVVLCISSGMRGPILQESDALQRESVKQVLFDDANISKAFNGAVGHADGEVLFFLDDSFELLSSESYLGLIEHVQRDRVGAVGGKVFYQNGLVEHGGIVFGPNNILGYAHRATHDGPGYAGLQNMILNYSAVMGLGMMTRKHLFMKIGGFDEAYTTDCWDADYCLKLRDLGYFITYTPYSTLRHHVHVQSANDIVEHPDADRFRARWQHVIDRDPFFNPNFSRQVESFGFDTLDLKLRSLLGCFQN